MEEWLSAISTVGFPIGACIGLFFYMNKESERHREETKELQAVIADNNTILAGLKQLLEDKLNG